MDALLAAIESAALDTSPCARSVCTRRMRSADAWSAIQRGSLAPLARQSVLIRLPSKSARIHTA